VQKSGRAVEVLKILDRREAIKQALAAARDNDLVLITGKGAEQKMALAHGRYIPWDDRQVAREELRKLVAS
jgi:UDP-N-acetylmuramoyl-L-alanyl-D-glutamate--2,6-diaminopimelate ligase